MARIGHQFSFVKIKKILFFQRLHLFSSKIMRTFLDSIGIERIVILMLILTTFILFNLVPRYEVSTINLLDNSDFSKGSKSWIESSGCGMKIKKSGEALLENRDAPCTVFLRQHLPIPQSPTQFVLAAEVNTRNTLQGTLPWQLARLYFVGIDKTGNKMWHHPHLIKLPLNSKGWQRVSQVFTMPPNAVELAVGLEIMETTGTLSVKKLHLAKVSENNWFSLAVNSLLILWGIVLFWLGLKLRQFFSSKIFLSSFLVVSSTIAIGCMLPNIILNLILEHVQETLKTLKLIIVKFFTLLYFPLELDIDFSFSLQGSGHFALFAMLAFLLRVGRYQDRLITQCLNLMLFAASTEVLQYFVAERQPAIADWLIDVGGLLLGLLFAELFVLSKKINNPYKC